MGGKHTGGGYKYVHSFIDNRGTRRWRYFRRGYPSKYLPCPSDPKFIEAYTAALQAPRGGFKIEQGYSLGRAIDLYLASRKFTDLAEGTKPSYESLLSQIGQTYGRNFVTTLTRAGLIEILEAIDSTSKRNRVLSMFRLVLNSCVDAGILEVNIARDIPRVRHRQKSYKTWTWDNIKRFEAAYPEGSTERLALYMLYYTGQRSSDCVTMGDHSLKEGRLIIRQKKTGARVSIPVHPTLAGAIPHGTGIWIRNGYGDPFSAKGFQQWFVKRIKRAGLEGLSGHGLRSAVATHLAKKGATPHQIQAITGHQNLGEVSTYTRAVSQDALADSAISMLD